MNSPSPEKNRRVLVIDDNRAIHDDFRKILSPSTATAEALDATEAALFGSTSDAILKTQFEVDSAYQGEEGLLLVKKAIADGRPYALAFVDVRMPPGMDGVETTLKIWALDPDLQIVLCTAYSDYSWGEMYEKLGHRDGLLILKKPFDTVEAFQLAHALTEKWWLHQQSRRKMEELENRVAERTQELAQSLSMLNATFDSTTDGIVAVDLSGKVVSYNAKFVAIWQLPAEMLARRDSTEMRAHAATQVKDSAQFLQRIKELHADPEAEGFDVIELKDGRTFERYVFPQRIDRKCVGTVVNWRDITERKQSENTLRESEEKFRQLAANITDVFYMTSPDMQQMLYVSPAYEQIWGRSTESLYANPYQWAEAILTEERERVFATFSRLAAGEPSVSAEFRIARPDGTMRWIHSRGFQVRDAAGKVIRITGIASDITERKQTQQSLRESEEHFRFLDKLTAATGMLSDPEQIMARISQMLGEHLRASRCAYADVDDDGEQFTILHDFTDGCASTIGKYQLSLFGQRAAATLRSGQTLIIRNVEAELSQDEGSDMFNAIGIKAIITCPLVKDGGLRAMMAVHQTTPRNWESGEITLVQEVVERCWATIERRRAEEELHLLGSAVEQSKESIVITDAELNLPGPKILFVNPAFTRMTGYTEVEVIGKTPRILQGPRTDKAVLSRLRQNLERGEVFEGEAINYRKDGKEFILEWQIAPLRNASGNITHFVAIQRDITDRKRLEAQLFQSQKLESVGKLSGGIAHEFNSILTAIIGQSELLLGDLPSGDRLANNAQEIRKAAERAALLTRQLLAYGRKQILQPEILDLNHVIAGMDGVLRHLMGGDVDVRIVPATGLKAVKADAGQIEQVIMNIVMNAADVMPNGGKLTLETANVTLDAEYVSRFAELKAGDYVMLAITDTGAGMSEAVKARVFEPFFTTKGVGQGTGLGLSTCYGIVKQSGGHIAVYSELGRGSTFKIYLPQVEQETKIPIQRLDSPELPRGTETILLVEDDPSLREMAAALLRRLGYTVLAAANGIEALNLKQQRDTGHIDLLFTDVVMPHMSGKELADRVRALYPHTKILFTSAYTENAIVHQGVLDKGVALLQKPFTPSVLAVKVREVLDEPSALKLDIA